MPSVFRLSLSINRTRPRTLAGKPGMIFTDTGGFDLRSARRTAVPAGGSAEFFGAQINPANALAATTAGAAKTTEEARSAHRPLKFACLGRFGGLAFFTEPRARPLPAQRA